MLSFTCASCKRLRIFEGIVGVFQDAHDPETLRVFAWSAHLRRPILDFGLPILDWPAIARRRMTVAI
jgi:hypothetical protein